MPRRVAFPRLERKAGVDFLLSFCLAARLVWAVGVSGVEDDTNLDVEVTVASVSILAGERIETLRETSTNEKVWGYIAWIGTSWSLLVYLLFKKLKITKLTFNINKR